MARILGLFPSALIAAQNNTGATAFYNMLRELGMGARTSEVYALYRMAKSITSAQGTEAFQPLEDVPDVSTLPAWPTRNATGVRQNISLVYRDRITGEQSRTFYSVTSESGITREEAISQAIQAYSDNAEVYGQDLIGAVHTSAYNLTPAGF